MTDDLIAWTASLGKTCAECDKPMIKRPTERPATFKRRVYCCPRCARKQSRNVSDAGRAVMRQNMAKAIEACRSVQLGDFFVSLRRQGECWIWPFGTAGGSKADPYGRITIDGELWLAHRLAYALAVGDIPEGMFVCHHCDTRLCCRPSHLFLGTCADNLADMVRKGRSRRGERSPQAKLSDQAVAYIRRSGERDNHLAVIFAVSATAIARARLGKTWAHVK